jgi:sterol desaturase/sphingolipid hydroxylase (fatty acid hydroxylase superfamily)
MAGSLVSIAVGFVVLALVFGAIERLFPAKRQPIVRPGWWTDLAYWVFTPLVTRAVTRVAVIAALVPVLLLAGQGLEPERIARGFGPLSRQPIWLQAIEMIVLGDFIGYWTHRWFHGGWRWRFHAIHHSSTHLDWLAAVRLHPVNDIIGKLAIALPMVGLGFSPVATAGVVPFLTFYAILLHANVDWSFGPLRLIIASPAFHRWHHTSAAEGLDRNFAGLLPLWDMLFGTFWLPDRKPTVFGVDDPVPAHLTGQLLWPFRRDHGRFTISR